MRLCPDLFPDLVTQSQSATVYFFCTISFFTQSQSATVYFFCTISYTVAVCDCVFLLYDFLHSRSLRLCISSVRFLSSSSYTVAVCDCVFLLYDFLHSRSLRLCISSVRFLSSSSVNTSKSYISDMTWPILTRLGHKYRLTIPFMWHDQIRVKGHVGVTGVKKVIFTKNATSPTDYRVWSCDSCTCISLTPYTKVMGLKIHPGSFGVTGVKKVIFTKNATSPTNYRVWSCDSCTYISLTPSTKVMGLKIHPGHLGSQGSKGHFH